MSNTRNIHAIFVGGLPARTGTCPKGIVRRAFGRVGLRYVEGIDKTNLVYPPHPSLSPASLLPQGSSGGRGKGEGVLESAPPVGI